MDYPSWWGENVRVTAHDGQHGLLLRAGSGGWLIHVETGSSEDRYVVNPDPGAWGPRVQQLLAPVQRDRIVHDSERALLRAFGCHYIPEWEALPERVRVGEGPHPKAVGRPELDGLQAILRGAVYRALDAYTRDG